jgi:uncharacterized protein GlcG (DUF336 family)
MLQGAAAEARQNQWNVSIAVVDDGGYLVGFLRMDGANALSSEAAVGKALSASMIGKPSKVLEEMINGGRTAAVSLAMTLLEGGEPITVDGACIGAVGVSGVKSADDARVARAGIAALSFKAV